MTDPYRDASGTRCPRCATILVEADGDGVLRCPNACGEWLPSGVVVGLLGTTQLAGRARPGLAHKATPLPPTRCLVCRAPLDDHYVAIGTPTDVLTLGACATHGVWLEQRDRQHFEIAYGVAMHKRREIAELEQAVEAGSPDVAHRIRALEDRVAALEARVEELARMAVIRPWSR